MRGYKVFDKDWTCKGFQYKVGEVYEMDKKPKCCLVGFHFCEELIDCFKHYSFNPEKRVAIVEALGDIDRVDGSKICTNKIKIIEEIPWYKVLNLVNAGDGNTGYHNTGHRNTGYWNAGHHNVGNYNAGNSNTGYRNTGDFNTGDSNTGDWNAGEGNTGSWNAGNHNAGHRNAGDGNAGNWNAGNRNTGDCNFGERNTGNWNIGDHNIGYWNTGDWNIGSYSTGCFNTKEQKIYMFNKKTNITYKEWRRTRARYILERMPSDNLVWIEEYQMTERERKNNPTYKTTGGYLKVVKVTDDDKQSWYDRLSDEDKKEIQNIPNFDAGIFKETTGIEV